MTDQEKADKAIDYDRELTPEEISRGFDGDPEIKKIMDYQIDKALEKAGLMPKKKRTNKL